MRVGPARKLTEAMNTDIENLVPQATVQGGPTEALAERLIEALVPALELLTVEFGRRLGLYAALAENDGATAGELAAISRIDARVAREWLEQQATAGFLRVDRPSADPDERRFALPAAHIPVLLVPESPAYAIGAATMLSGTASAFEAVVEAARSGTGVSYGAFGAGVRHGLQQLNRPGFVGELTEWMARLPDVSARLRSGGRILDLGCGTGWSSVALARLFPEATVIGVDLDDASIAEARALAAAEGLAPRLRFEQADATDGEAMAALTGGGAQLVTIFEALHDMNEPQDALDAARRALAADGAILVGDERVADEFGPDGDFLERLNYGFSVLHCLPATMAEGAGVANGTVLRPATLRAWAAGAGLNRVDELDIEHPFWRFYRLDR